MNRFLQRDSQYPFAHSRKIAITFFIALICMVAPASAGMITITTNQDAGLRGDNAFTRNAAEGLDDKLVTRQNDPSYGLIQFDLSGVTTPIVSATLRMEWNASNVLNQGVSVYRFGTSWTENTVTWNSVNGGADPFGQVIGGALDSVNSPDLGSGTQTGTFAEWDVTAAAQEWKAGTLTNNGLLIRSFGSSDLLSFWSLQGVPQGRTAPQLNVQTAAVPEPSTFAIMGIGLIGVAGYGWRQRRQRAAFNGTMIRRRNVVG
jgi:PEP-CTERM motif